MLSPPVGVGLLSVPTTSSKSSTVWRAMLETVTCTVAVRPPAVAVMVPVPGVVAVKLPDWSIVPMLPVTAQVKASGSAFREMWL